MIKRTPDKLHKLQQKSWDGLVQRGLNLFAWNLVGLTLFVQGYQLFFEGWVFLATWLATPIFVIYFDSNLLHFIEIWFNLIRLLFVTTITRFVELIAVFGN